MASLDDLFTLIADRGASDLHLRAGAVPRLRVDGVLAPTDLPATRAEDTAAIARALVPAERLAELDATGSVTASHAVAGRGRFRVSVTRQRGTTSVVVHAVAPTPPSLADLQLPPALEQLADLPHGLVLIAGPHGSGTTTTVAAMVDRINRTRPVTVVTVEEPVAVDHPDDQALVTQLEVPTDAPDLLAGLRAARGHDADVVALGALHDDATRRAALDAAEAGHLVVAELRATGAIEAVDRLLDAVGRKPSDRARVAAALGGVVVQQLLPAASGRGRVPATEVLLVTAKVADRLRDPDGGPTDLDGRRETLADLLADGQFSGMHTFDQCLLDLHRRDLVDARVCLAAAVEPAELRISFQAAGLLAV